MSVELYPDHKAILHFYHSLKVYEIDFLSHLTDLFNSKKYQHRTFKIYAKPTLNYSSFDFVIVEPNQAVYIIQTPRDEEEYQQMQGKYRHFKANHLALLSPMLKRNINIMNSKNQRKKLDDVIKFFYYVYDKDLYDTLKEKEHQNLIQPIDFQKQTSILQEIFKERTNADYSLTGTETKEIVKNLNPYTNFKHYLPKKTSKQNQEATKSKAQAKEKFKGGKKAGKSTILAKRIASCAQRLNGKGKILVVSGCKSKEAIQFLKDLITAESGRSLQELGIDLFSYLDLKPISEKYVALFIDDAQYFENEWFNVLLENYLIDRKEEADYEYIVMSEDSSLPKVSEIYGPFKIIHKEEQEMSQLLSESRKIFLDILKG